MAAPSQDFSAQNLGWMRRYRKQFGLIPDEGKTPRTRAEWGAFLAQLEQRVASEEMHFGKIRIDHVRKKGKVRQIVSTKSLDEVLVLRRMNENIRRAYGIRSPNRAQVMRTLVQALGEATPKQVLRIDVKSCFETISKAEVRRRLIADGVVSYQTIHLLDKLYSALHCRPNYRFKRGVPRGLAISGTLAEIYLRDLERALKEIDGVYLVLRYVDDILILGSSTTTDLRRLARVEAQKLRLKLNSKKTTSVAVACKCEEGCPHGDFCPCNKKCVCDLERCEIEYLGYRLCFPGKNEEKSTNGVVVGLSDAKIKKIKTRIILASRSYLADGDYDLYMDRLACVTGNVQLMSKAGERGLASGLAYTHEAYDAKGAENADLEGLNEFLRRSIRFSMRLRSSPEDKYLNPFKYDFISGFKNKRRVKREYARMLEISRCWRHV